MGILWLLTAIAVGCYIGFFYFSIREAIKLKEGKYPIFISFGFCTLFFILVNKIAETVDTTGIFFEDTYQWMGITLIIVFLALSAWLARAIGLRKYKKRQSAADGK